MRVSSRLLSSGYAIRHLEDGPFVRASIQPERYGDAAATF